MASSSKRVIRGGGWLSKEERVRCGFRLRNDPDGGFDNVGFRIARSLSP